MEDKLHQTGPPTELVGVISDEPSESDCLTNYHVVLPLACYVALIWFVFKARGKMERPAV